ncbi:MAG: hypothetical protein Q4E65_00260 [Clostridia bacterium]|nr:hypothetical protein [Clostridia bacterium]
MKIDSSAVQLTSSSVRTEIYAKKQTIASWIGERPAALDGNAGMQNAVAPAEEEALPEEKAEGVVVDLSDRGNSAMTQSTRSSRTNPLFSYDLGDKGYTLLMALQEIIEALTGRKIKFHFFDEVSFSQSFDQTFNMVYGQGQGQSQGGWGMIMESQEYYQETEQVSFASEGRVKTADGREIAFNVDLSMSRSFAEANSFSLRLGNANLCDPLVVNFDAASAGLSNTKFSFDLDADGKSDQISTLLQGSGFLALDKNADGVVNDGNELFGTQSGDGFADLSRYDSDGNNWIDENDPIYDKLRIWMKDDAGNSKLIALGEKGIGAIYLGNVSTEYGLKDHANQLNGQLRSTGVFLRENGTAGTIQHVDLAL